MTRRASSSWVPEPFGMCALRTGVARYVPDVARSRSDWRFSSRCFACPVQVCPSAPGAPSTRRDPNSRFETVTRCLVRLPGCCLSFHLCQPAATRIPFHVPNMVYKSSRPVNSYDFLMASPALPLLRRWVAYTPANAFTSCSIASRRSAWAVLIPARSRLASAGS